ncbi:hypothetical protein DW187_11625 [Ruminococcus sp. AM16-34]|jgi:yheO domain protein|nr:hypothetical protein DW187_11625 [Ruminococcus sp. AM16-34]
MYIKIIKTVKEVFIMTNKEILSIFVPIVNFLSEILGENTEIVLHDVSNPEHSVIAIQNGFHSGRTIGSSLTDFAFQVTNNQAYTTQDYLVNYTAKARGKDFIASTFYIKNNGELIGMLCLNTDTTIITNFMKAAQQFVGCLPMGVSMTMGETITGSTTMVEENLDVPIVSFAESIISKTIADSNIPPERMTRQEKMEIVWELTNQGIPRMKGAISEIAKQLELSESTVYRYISLKED